MLATSLLGADLLHQVARHDFAKLIAPDLSGSIASALRAHRRQVFHSTDLYNSQTRVPLVIAGPGIKTQRIGETVSLTDLTPSLLEFAGFAAPTGLDGVGCRAGVLARKPACDGCFHWHRGSPFGSTFDDGTRLVPAPQP